MPSSRATTFALILLLVVPPAALAAHTPADGPSSSPAPGPDAATPTGTPPVNDPSPPTILRGLYHTADVDPDDPEPLPGVSEEDPLVTALEHLADARGAQVDDQALERAREDADELPPDLRTALALVVEANAEATEAQRQAAEDGTLDRSRSAADALHVARAIDAALPVLRKYSLFYSSDAGALRVSQARTVDTVVALATGSQPLQSGSAEADLPGAVTAVYDQVGVSATSQDLQRLEAGAQRLPDDVRRAATVLAEGQARTIELRAEALEGTDARDLDRLRDPAAGDALSGDPSSDVDEAQAWVDAAHGVDRSKLAQAQLTAVTAALQANAILQSDETEAGEDQGLLSRVLQGLADLVDALNPVATASAQTGPGGCPETSPLADCDNDVWFTDPFGIVVVSGGGTTVYDARYGQVSLSNRTGETLRRLPTDGLTVDSRAVVRGTSLEVRGSVAREIAENATRNPVIKGIDEAALQRPFYVATLDLGGDDVYTHQTASTLPLPDGADPGAVPLLANALVDVGGDDLYDPGLADGEDGSIANATAGGQAVLLDAAGDDTYRGGNHSIATASTLGQSALLDLDGHDTYEAGHGSVGVASRLGASVLVDDCAAPVTDECSGGDDVTYTGSQSQGVGILAGVGALVNRGGNDTYDLGSAPGQGHGDVLGVGAFADVGGDDDAGIRDETRGRTIQALDESDDETKTAEVLARPNDQPIRGSVWAEDTTDSGAGLALEVDHPAAFELTTGGGGVIASFERTAVPGLELPGLFFVDGAADTTYDQDYVLIVDLAGSDTYNNNAGGAVDLSDASVNQSVAGTALALDLAGSDVYDATGTSNAAVQGSALNGVGLLLDLGRSPDAYVAGDVSQGAAGEDAVGLLLDDGSIEGKDRFRGGDSSQGSASVGGIGALVTLNGDSTYEAGSRSQGFGSHGGIGLLVDRQIDRRAGKVSVDGFPDPDSSGEDEYDAEALAQGTGVAGGLGLLADTGGDDRYTLDDRGQGYAEPNATDAPGVDVKRPRTPADVARGLLVDLAGRDLYTADGEGEAARAHGFAGTSATSDRGRALLADFALPRVPLLTLRDIRAIDREEGAFTVNETLLAEQSTAPLFPDWDPTDFYDDWLREGLGDRYVPATTFDGQDRKRENAYWQQPSHPDPGEAVAGVGMDNPPIAAPKAGSDRFFGAARTVEDTTATATNGTRAEGVDLTGLVVESAEPQVDLHVHPSTAGGGCGDADIQLTEGETCLEAHVEQADGVTGDPDRNMEVTFQLRRDEATDWETLGSARSDSLVEATQRAIEEAGGVSGLFTIFGGFNLLDPTANIGGTGVAEEAAVHLVFDTSNLCSETDGVGYCPSEAPDEVDLPAWPDGDYEVRAQVRTITSTVTAGEAAAEARAPMEIQNPPRLLGVVEDDAAPASGKPAELTLLTDGPHRGYEVTLEDANGQAVDVLRNVSTDERLGVRDEARSLPDATPPRPVYATSVHWLPEEPELVPGPVSHVTRLAAGNETLDEVHALDVEDGGLSPRNATLPGQRPGASAVWHDGQALVLGGRVDGEATDEIRVFDPDASDEVVLSTGFESAGSLDGWRFTDASGPASWDRTDGASNDGQWSLAVEDAGANETDIATSPILNFTGVESPHLTLQQNLDGETADGCFGDCPALDYGVVEVSRVGSSQWRAVTDRQTSTSGWETLEVSLGRYAGDQVQVRFRFVTDEADHGSSWAVDDLHVDARATQSLGTSLPAPLTDAEAVSADGAVYVFGGRTPGGLQDTILRVDPGTVSVSSVGSLPGPRAHVAAAWNPADGVAVLFGGTGPDGPVDDVLVFDPASGAVTPAEETLPAPRTDAAALWDGDDQAYYVYGGAEADGLTADVARLPRSLDLPEDSLEDVPTAPGDQAPLFDGGFEATASLAGWSLDDKGGPSAWVRTPALSDTGDRSLAIRNVGAGEEDVARTPTLEVPDVPGVQLAFRHHLEGEEAFTTGGDKRKPCITNCEAVDYGVVEVRNPGGEWTALADRMTATDGWETASFPLFGYEGEQVQIRFRFVTDGSDHGEDDDHGHHWAIDAVRDPGAWTRVGGTSSTWELTALDATDGDTSAAVRDAGSWENHTLVSRPIDLSNLQDPHIVLDTRFDSQECQPRRCPLGDHGNITVEDVELGGREQPVDPLVGTDGWETLTLNVSDFADRTVRLRFNLTTNGTQDGASWFVDDLRVRDPYFPALQGPRRDAAALPETDVSLADGGNAQHTIVGGWGPQGLVDTADHHVVSSVSPRIVDGGDPLPELRQDTLAVRDVDDDRTYVLGAAAEHPGAVLGGTIHLDSTPPTASLPVEEGPLGCLDVPCPPVPVPVRAGDDQSGIEAVEVTLSTADGTEEVTVTPDEGTPTRLDGAAVGSLVNHTDTLEVEATPVDAAGNRGETVTALYNVDLLPPTSTTNIPNPPNPGDDVLLANSTDVEVGWDGLQDGVTHVERVHLDYRVRGIHGSFQDGVAVETSATSGTGILPLGELAPDHVDDGVVVDVVARGEDAAGNLEPASPEQARTLELDLTAPGIRALDVDPGFRDVRASWNLTEPAVSHQVTVTGPDGETATASSGGLGANATDSVALVVTGLESGTTYNATVRSLDAAANPSTKSATFTTESSLSLEWETPRPGALVSGDTALAFRVGATSVARDDDTTFSLRAVPATGGTVALREGTPIGVTGTLDSPEPPSISPYPIEVDTTDAPDGRDVTLRLEVTNEHGSTSVTRTLAVDNTPPRPAENATVALEGPEGPVAGEIPWFQGPVEVTDVPVTDDVSGVNRTLYGWTNQTDAVFDPGDPPNRTREGIHSFQYRAVDEAGNEDPLFRIRRFGIDTTPPTANVSVEDRSVEDRNVSLSLAATDGLSGAVQVRTYLPEVTEETPGWDPLNASTSAPSLTLPDADGRYTVTVAVRDRAGNVARENLTFAYSTRPPALEGEPSAAALSPVDARVTWATDKPSVTDVEVGGNASATLRVETPGFTTDHEVLLGDLEPDSRFPVELRLADQAGHSALAGPVNVTTTADPSPPTAPTNLTAMDTRDGSVVLAWSPARDEAGVDRYRVERSPPDAPAYETVANVSVTQFVDRGVALGTPYAYRVAAVDGAGKLGPAANASAVPTAPPVLSDPAYDVGSVNGTTVLLLEVTVEPRGRLVETVHAVVDGARVPMTQENVTADGIVYQTTVNGTELELRDGVDVRFEASDAETTVEHPDEGALHLEGDEFPGPDDGDGFPVPGPGAGVLAAAAAAAVALRRRGGSGPASDPGGGPPKPYMNSDVQAHAA